jgi:hypothetical protein
MYGFIAYSVLAQTTTTERDASLLLSLTSAPYSTPLSSPLRYFCLLGRDGRRDHASLRNILGSIVSLSYYVGHPVRGILLHLQVEQQDSPIKLRSLPVKKGGLPADQRSPGQMRRSASSSSAGREKSSPG